MSRAQRLVFLGIAVVIAIVAVILLWSGSTSEEQDEPPANVGATATATATEAPAETATATPTPPPHRPEPSTLTQGRVTKLRFTEGDIVRFRVESDVADHVHVHGYDLMRDIEAGQTLTISFPASITGIFEIELEDAGEQIGQLRVDPK